MIAAKKGRDAPLTEDDRVDLSLYDNLLISIREEMTKIKRQIRADDEQAKPVAQLVAVDRKQSS